MAKYLLKWISASLVMPVLVAIKQSTFGGLVHVFWPGSIVLMSLGAEPSSTSNVIIVWSAAVLSNVVLYVVLGLAVYYLFKLGRGNRNEGAKAP